MLLDRDLMVLLVIKGVNFMLPFSYFVCRRIAHRSKSKFRTSLAKLGCGVDYLWVFHEAIILSMFIDREAGEIIRLVVSVCLFGFVRSTLCTTLWVQDYIFKNTGPKSFIKTSPRFLSVSVICCCFYRLGICSPSHF